MYLARNLNPVLTLSLLLLQTPALAQEDSGREPSDEDLIAEAEAGEGSDDESTAERGENTEPSGEKLEEAESEEGPSDEDLIEEAESEEGPSDEDLIEEAESEEGPSDEDLIEEEASRAQSEERSASERQTSRGNSQSSEGATAEEQALFAPGEEPNRPPAVGMGVIWGRLLDAASGDPVLEGSVKVEGLALEALVDFDGFFRLELPPGTYTLKLFVPLYEEEQLGNVIVTADQVGRVNAALQPQEDAVFTEVIEDTAETQTVEGLALARQRSAAQGDAVGREEISKTTDSNAAQAAQRVVGANIVGGRFVYVRGLGERYSNSLIGGYPLPSPEPDRAAVPLDVFPTAVIDSLTIVKTFTPDMPADFAGGSVQIETRSVPKKPVLKISLSGGYNTQATFKKRLDHGSSSTDWAGFDSGMRSLPSSIPSEHSAKAGSAKPDGSTVSTDELIEPGQDINSRMSAKLSRSPFNHGVGIVAGNTWDVGKSKLGVLAAANYSRSYTRVNDATWISFDSDLNDERGILERLKYKSDWGEEQIRWGGFSKVTLVPDPNHKISITGLHSQMANDRTQIWYGSNRISEGEFHATQLDWVERGMTFGVLSGRHTFEKLDDAELGWDVSIARAYRHQPDRRDTVYRFSDRVRDPNDGSRTEGWEYINKTESGRHFWAEQTERSNGGKLDWRQPLLDGETGLDVKFGGLANLKRRDFNVRRFQMFPLEDSICLGSEYSLSCPDDLFVDENIGRTLQLDEGSQEGDAYDASLDVLAGYAMLDLDLSERLRLVGGARYEHTRQKIDPLTPFGDPAGIDGADLKSNDLLPAISAVFNATEKFKTRLSYSHTLARPQVRELAPFSFADYFGGVVVSGNPDLKLTQIRNVDMRVELWPSLTEVLAASVFYKDMTDPIETLQIPSGGNPQITYENADKARVIGTELEARKHVWGPFGVISNLTLTQSRTEVEEAEGNSIITNRSRPLINQAPWVFNFAVDFDNQQGTTSRLTYNVNSPTLVNVGTEGLTDAYNQSFHRLDFNISQKFWERFSVSASAKNLLNDDVVVSRGKKAKEGENIERKFKRGTTFGVALRYEM